MRILILDDDHTGEREPQFRDNLQGHDVVLVRTPDECQQLLAKQDWHWLFLDHDLGDAVGAGYKVADWLEEHPEHNPLVGAVVHSMNSIGADRIYAALPGPAWCLPGCWSDPQLGLFIASMSNTEDSRE